MITEQDLRQAIAECQGERNPDARTCIKLAAYLTIKEHLYPQVVDGKDMTEVWKIMDELMGTLQVIQPRLYDSVIRKIDSI